MNGLWATWSQTPFKTKCAWIADQVGTSLEASLDQVQAYKAWQQCLTPQQPTIVQARTTPKG